MPEYNYFAPNGGIRTTYKDVDHLTTQTFGATQTFVVFYDNNNQILAIVNLAPGERIERVPRQS